MKKNLMILFLLVSFALASCNLPTNQQTTPTREADAILTAAAQTVAVQLTQGVNMPTPGPTLALDTPIPTLQPGETTAASTATQTNAPDQPTRTPDICNKADFVEDVTIEDGTVISPGEVFTKTWRLKNTGTCTWTTGYAAVFDRENLMGAQSVVTLPKTVAPNDTVDISVQMTAPNIPGDYSSYWMLRNDQGAVFGLGSTADQPFYTKIEVAAAIFAVTGVYPSVDPGTYEGVCNPASIKFKADIRANKAGTVQYHWEFSDAPDSPVVSLTFTEAGTKPVEYTLEISKSAGEYTGWGAVYIDDPNHQEFSRVNYTLKCQ